MINSKKLSLVMLLSASMILAGCNNATPSSSDASASSATPSDSSVVPSVDPSSTEETPADVPTQEGATTFYIEVAEDSVALPSWCSYFLTGCMNGWKTTIADGAIELEQLEDTNIYYAIVAGYDDDANKADRGYQVTMGYNESSNLGASSLGINWSYKGQSNNSFSGLDHPVFDAPVDGIVHITALWSDGTVDEGGFKWTAALPEPIVAKNYTVKFALGIELAATVSAWNAEMKASGVTGFAVKGGHNDWAWTPMTKIDDTHYSFTVESIICGVSYEMCVAPLTAAGVDGDAYNLSGTGAKAADTTDEDGKFHVGNFFFTPMALDGDNFTFEWGELVLPAKASGTDKAYVLPSATKLNQTITIRVFDIENGTGLADGLHLYVAGSWNGWSASEDNIMTENEGVYSYVIPSTVDIYEGVALEFGVISNSTWAGKLVAAGETEGTLANFKIIPEVNKVYFDIVGDLSKNGTTDSAGTVNYHGQYVNGIVITVSDIEGGTGLAAGLSLYVAGSWNGWSASEGNIMTKVEDKYTYTVPNDKVCVGDSLEFGVISNSSWAGKLVDEGDANFKFIVEADKLHVNIVGDLSKNGTTNSAGTLAYVA